MRRQLFYGPVFFILAWYLAWLVKIINPLFLPSPHSTFESLAVMLFHVSVWQDILATLWRVTESIIFSSLIGIPIGLWIGYYHWAYRSSELLLDFFRSLPALALFPLFMLFFGLGDGAKIATAVFACSLVIMLNTRYGVTQSPDNRRIVAEVLGASRLELFSKVIFRDALPQIFVGLRTALSLAVIVIVVTEMFVGTTHGLGHRIYDTQLRYRVAEMYASIIFTGLIGYVLNKFVVVIEHRIVHWSGK